MDQVLSDPDNERTSLVGESATSLLFARGTVDDFAATQIVPADTSVRLRRLIETIHARLFDPSLNVGAAKAIAGIRDHNVSSEFRHRFGVSIREYVEALRLAAVDHLQRHQVPVTLAARCSGFNCVQTYYRARTRQQTRTRASAAAIATVAESQTKREADL